MAKLRGKLKSGFYIKKKEEKVYISDVKNGNIIYGGKGGSGARRFSDNDSAYEFLDKHNLRKTHKVIPVR